MEKLTTIIILAIASMAHAQVFGPRQGESDAAWWERYQQEVREQVERQQLEQRIQAIENEARRQKTERDCDDNFYIRWAR
jgi:hypothetical protein